MVPALAAPPALSLVRRATSQLHSRIDRSSVLASLLTDQRPSLHMYAVAMLALDQAYARVDTILTESSDLCPAGVPPYVARVPRITQDLAVLRRTVPVAVNTHHLQSGADSPLRTPHNRAGYLGIRYAVEGAQLGARVIYRHLQKSYGDEISRIGSFWQPDPAMQRTWPAVLESLGDLSSRSDLATVAVAARQTFRHMELFLSVAGSTALSGAR